MKTKSKQEKLSSVKQQIEYLIKFNSKQEYLNDKFICLIEKIVNDICILIDGIKEIPGIKEKFKNNTKNRR